MTEHSDAKRIIAIDIRSRHFSFVVFEGQNRLLDWGARSFREGKNAVKVPAAQKLLSLFNDFTPSVVVTRRMILKRSSQRAKTFAVMEDQARGRKIPVRFVSPRDLNTAFLLGSKYEIASALAKRFPALESRLPPKRKCWQSEDYRMGLFDAAAIGVAYFSRRGQARSEHPLP